MHLSTSADYDHSWLTRSAYTAEFNEFVRSDFGQNDLFRLDSTPLDSAVTREAICRLFRRGYWALHLDSHTQFNPYTPSHVAKESAKRRFRVGTERGLVQLTV